MQLKNIILLGCARSGKTTLAKLIHEKYNYSIISIDSMVSAFKYALPEVGITNKNTPNKFEILPNFVYNYIKKFMHEYPNENFILEGWHVFPKNIYKLVKEIDIDIICLGYTNISSKEMLNFIRENEKEYDYTKNMSDEDLLDLINNHIEYSKTLKKQCSEINIPFFDISYNKEQVTKKIISYLSR